jgi:hypothetical protein
MARAYFNNLALDPNTFRLQVTIASLVIAGVLTCLMVLLRKVCRSLDLQLFKRILTWGIFYVPLVTVLMITGLWLDFKMGYSMKFDPSAVYFRVAYIFISECTLI